MHTEAAAFWDAQAENPHLSAEAWTSHRLVQHYLACSVNPVKPQCPLDFLRSYFEGRRFRRGLSIGCGSGVLERIVLANGLCETVDAFDGGIFSLLKAKKEARSAGVEGRARYFAADFNRPVLPRNTYDIVFFNQSLHHVANLEGLLRAVINALKPDGYLFLDEYVGPSRTQWTRELLAPLRALHQLLPLAWRRSPALDPPVEVADPSEAIRSGEIERLVGVGFDTVLKRGYGGNILSVLYPKIRWDEAPEWLVENLIDVEKAWLESSGQPSFYSVLICTPRRGLSGVLAKSHLAIRPLLMGMRYQFLLRKRLGKFQRSLAALVRFLERYGEQGWPSRIRLWIGELQQYRQVVDVTKLIGVIEQIRDATLATDAMFGGLYLPFEDKTLRIPSKEEEFVANHGLQKLSLGLRSESECLLEDFRSAIVGHYGK
ncbi:MAG TPA: class I SAM-dependent methyltransferase [Thermoanaerobaculia bacterium]|nr:class I SAM-dependent methyltransferase [Thermoanaerobaculia bacterium]